MNKVKLMPPVERYIKKLKDIRKWITGSPIVCASPTTVR